MRILPVFVAAVISGAAPARSQPAASPSQPEAQVRQELVEAEQSLLDALARYDVDALDLLWSDDFIFTAPNGRITTKAERIAGVKAAASAKDSVVGSTANDEIKVHVHGRTAVVTVHSTWRDKGKDEDPGHPYQATHVWVKQENRWRLVAAHVTPVSVK